MDDENQNNNNSHTGPSESEKEEEGDTSDISLEPEEEDGNPALSIKKLREKLKTALNERAAYLLGWQRAKADYINAKKRAEEERREFIKFSNASLLEELIPVLDSFDMAFRNREAWEKAPKDWRTGIEYIHAQLLGVLSAHGVKTLDPIGRTFSPTEHEAIEFIPTDNPDKEGIILETLQKGYELNGRIIKPPKVKVGEFKK